MNHMGDWFCDFCEKYKLQFLENSFRIGQKGFLDYHISNFAKKNLISLLYKGLRYNTLPQSLVQVLVINILNQT